jgi:hypothetical protein
MAPAERADQPRRAALFRSPGFPTADAPEIPAATLDQAVAGLPIGVLDSPEALAGRLRRPDFEVLVLPYGSALPLEAWPAIRDFVGQGGGLVVLGGAPLQQPVRREGSAQLEARPLRATVQAGEAAILRILLHRPVVRPEEAVPAKATVSVRAGDDSTVFSGEVELVGPPELRTGLITVATRAPLPPGLYPPVGPSR